MAGQTPLAQAQPGLLKAVNSLMPAPNKGTANDRGQASDERRQLYQNMRVAALHLSSEKEEDPTLQSLCQAIQQFATDAMKITPNVPEIIKTFGEKLVQLGSASQGMGAAAAAPPMQPGPPTAAPMGGQPQMGAANPSPMPAA